MARVRPARARVSFLGGAALVLFVSASSVAATGFLYQWYVTEVSRPMVAAAPSVAPLHPDRQLPADAAMTVLVESYPDTARSEPAIRQLTTWLEALGHRVYYQTVDLGPEGQWRRVLSGSYSDQEYESAAWDAARLKAAAPVLEARVITRTAADRRR